MSIQETLTQLGFEEKEAKLYLATLELGPSTVLEISRKSGLKRPTCYLLLDEMTSKGWIEKTNLDTKITFSAKDPSYLLTSIQEKERALEEALPYLAAMAKGMKDRPKITVYEGKDGMRQIYSDIFSSSQIWWFASIHDINKSFSDVTKEMVEISKKKKPEVREILTSHPEDIAFAKSAIAPNYSIRIAPPEMPISIDMAIYQNKIAIFSVKKNLFATVIESDDVAESFRTFHQLAWNSATPVEKYL